MSIKVFESMYDSDLFERWEALITFQQFLILADEDGRINMPVKSIHRRTGIPFEILKEGTTILQNGTYDGILLIDKDTPCGWAIIRRFDEEANIWFKVGKSK